MKDQEQPATRLMRNVVVNKELQYAIILFSIIFASVTNLISLCFYYFINSIDGFDASNITYFIAVALSAFLLVGAVVFGLFLTNKIAGPIRRLHHHILLINSGEEAGLLAFRKGDFFSEIVDPFNELLKNKVLNKPKNDPSDPQSQN